MSLIIYTDGGARGNPGPAASGAVIFHNGTRVGQVSEYLGDGLTNNWAEYEAVILALREAKRLGLAGESLEMRLDSKLVVEQVSGNWKIKEPSLKPKVMEIRTLLADFPGARLVHIPREQNKEADRLVNEALDAVG